MLECDMLCNLGTHPRSTSWINLHITKQKLWPVKNTEMTRINKQLWLDISSSLHIRYHKVVQLKAGEINQT